VQALLCRSLRPRVGHVLARPVSCRSLVRQSVRGRDDIPPLAALTLSHGLESCDPKPGWNLGSSSSGLSGRCSTFYHHHPRPSNIAVLTVVYLSMAPSIMTSGRGFGNRVCIRLSGSLNGKHAHIQAMTVAGRRDIFHGGTGTAIASASWAGASSEGSAATGTLRSCGGRCSWSGPAGRSGDDQHWLRAVFTFGIPS